MSRHFCLYKFCMDCSKSSSYTFLYLFISRRFSFFVLYIITSALFILPSCSGTIIITRAGAEIKYPGVESGPPGLTQALWSWACLLIFLKLFLQWWQSSARIKYDAYKWISIMTWEVSGCKVTRVLSSCSNSSRKKGRTRKTLFYDYSLTFASS